MAAFRSLFMLSLLSFACATPPPQLRARQINVNCDTASLVTSCLSVTGTSTAAYVTSLCGLAVITPKTTTTVPGNTSTTTVLTNTTVTSPRGTVTKTFTSTANLSTTVTSTSTITSGTTRSYLSTSTVSVTNTSYVFTCPGTTASPLATIVSSVNSANFTTTPVVQRRQQATGVPSCASDFQENCGKYAVLGVCSSLGITAGSAPSTSTVRVTGTSTIVTATSTHTTTRRRRATVSITVTTTRYASSTDVVTTTVPSPVGEILTTTVYTVTTVTTSTPTPSSFGIVINSVRAAAKAIQDSGLAIAVNETQSASGDQFLIDSAGKMTDITAQYTLVLRYKDNARPYLFLYSSQNPAASNDLLVTPTFSLCNGKLLGNYGGGAPSEFGVCDGFLSLGADGSSGLEGCDTTQPDIDPAAVNINGTAITASTNATVSATATSTP